MNILRNLKELNSLDIEINSLKENLYNLMCGSELTDVNVVECSQKLDELILIYQKQDNLI